MPKDYPDDLYEKRKKEFLKQAEQVPPEKLEKFLRGYRRHTCLNWVLIILMALLILGPIVYEFILKPLGF